MTEQSIIDNLNDFIEEENGLPIGIDSFLTDSDMDSFAYAVFWFKVEDEYPCITKEYYDKINYITYEVRELVEKINECS